MKLEELTKEQLIEEVRKLKSRKKFGLVWEEKPEDVVEKCKLEIPFLKEDNTKNILIDSNYPTNLIIEGDNYHSLLTLNYTHAGKIDLIYIDPPYNTGNKSWKYNNDYVDKEDVYRHSKWLSMMSKRIKLAKNLLKKDGVLICAIDENEYARLSLLLEEIFYGYEQHSVVIIHNPKGVQGKNFSYTHEYAIFVVPSGDKIIRNRKLEKAEIYISNLRNWGSESLRTDAKNCFYPIMIKNEKIIGFGDVCADDFHPASANIELKEDGIVLVYPIDDSGVERKWRYARQSVESIRDILIVSKSKKGNYQIKIAKDYGTLKTVWTDKKYDASEYGTKLIKKIVIDCVFVFPKSLYTVYDCVAAVVADKKESVILDFFAGSGTTGHAVMELNKTDKGKRSFILCTNNENGIAEDVCYPRIKGVIDGYENIKGIPTNLRYYRTAFLKKSPVSDDIKTDLIRKAVEMICVKEGTFEEVFVSDDYKIFKDAKHTTAILFNLDCLEELKEKIEFQNLPSSLYVFSLSNDTYDKDFENLSVEHELCPIPESILEVYRKLFKE